MTEMAPGRRARVNVPISPKTDDALNLIMRHEGVSQAEAMRRLVGYGELLFRTVRMERGDVLLRHGRDVERVVLLDEPGDALVRDAALLVWMRPSGSLVACAFSRVESDASDLVAVESIAGCDSFPVADLVVAEEQTERCRACQRTATQWRKR
jgi:hypothetical protein